METSEIFQYINSYYDEVDTRRQENIMLSALKNMYEQNPTSENNLNWLNFSDEVINRRKNRSLECQQNQK